MSDTKLALVRNAFFADANLDADSLEQTVAALVERQFPKGTVIFREGDAAPEMFFIVSGKVGIFKRTGESRVLLAELGAGGYFGEVALVDGGARSADAEALEDVSALALDDPTFDALLDRVPRLGVFFLKATSKRLRALNRQVAVPEKPAAAGDPIADDHPFPIASVYRNMSVLVDPRPRLERFLDLLEVTIRYLGAVALAQYLAGERSSEHVDDVIVRGVRNVTLGQWIAIVRESLLPYDDAVDALFVPELHRARYERPGRPSEDALMLERVLSFRNAVRHGAGGAMTEQAAKAALGEHEPLLSQLLGRMSFLVDYSLVWLERMHFEKGSFVYRYQRCMGSHDDFASHELRLQQPFETGRLYLLSRSGDALLPMHPLMLLDACSVCTLRDVFFLYGVGADSADYAELVRGHHHVTTSTMEALAEMRSSARARVHEAEKRR